MFIRAEIACRDPTPQASRPTRLRGTGNGDLVVGDFIVLSRLSQDSTQDVAGIVAATSFLLAKPCPA